MRLTVCALAAIACALAACDQSAKVTGSMDDGETLTGVAIGTGFADQSGTLQIIGNRTTNCVGTYVFEGLYGPAGKATLNCTGGAVGEATLDMGTKTGVGSIGGRRITFTWR